jgi:hypothetical protein
MKKSVLAVSPGEVAFCSLETSNKITAKTKTVCFSKDYKNKDHNPEKQLNSSTSKDVFCSSETKHDRRTGLDQFFFTRRLQEQRSHCPEFESQGRYFLCLGNQ